MPKVNKQYSYVVFSMPYDTFHIPFQIILGGMGDLYGVYYVVEVRFYKYIYQDNADLEVGCRENVCNIIGGWVAN